METGSMSKMNNYEYIVKKYNLKVGNQYVVEIPNITRNDLAKLFAELNFNKGVELGVENGYYSEILCKANPKLHLFGVDPYLSSAYEKGSTGVIKTQGEHNTILDGARKLLKPYNCTIIRKTSTEALDDFKDNSLDFVYIDANHDFPNFTFDIHNWLKKVKEDGIISGHDYAYFSYRKYNHVKRALIAYARSYRMIPLFIAGGEDYEKGVKRDQFRSWFWIKDK